MTLTLPSTPRITAVADRDGRVVTGMRLAITYSAVGCGCSSAVDILRGIVLQSAIQATPNRHWLKRRTKNAYKDTDNFLVTVGAHMTHKHPN
jgi:hypothetical protein